MLFAIGLWTVLRAVLFGPATIARENVALRHQLRVLQRSVRRPGLLDGIGPPGHRGWLGRRAGPG
jgi:hypothetical protein